MTNNNVLKDLTLAYFVTTLGHYGFKDIYKYSLKYLNQNFGLENFGDKRAVIKVFNNEDSVFDEMSKSFDGFQIFKEYGSTGINDNPHQDENTYAHYLLNNYLVSIINMYSSDIKTEFVLWYQDDEVLGMNRHKLELAPHDYFASAFDVLRKHPDVFAVYFEGPEHPLETDHLFGYRKYAFAPHIARTKDYFKIVTFIRYNFKQFLGAHPEMACEMVVKHFNPKANFAMFNSKFIWNRNLGGGNSLEVRKELGLFI